MRIVTDEEELDWMGQDCWFCNQRPPVRGKSSRVKLKKFADGAGSSVRILRCSVSVPRCEECAAGHFRASSKAMNLALAGAFVVFLVVVVWRPVEMPWWVMALLVLAGSVPGAAMLGSTAGLPPAQKPEREAEAFMAVERLKRDGWMKDDQP
jgi:hypothetical protein